MDGLVHAHVRLLPRAVRTEATLVWLLAGVHPLVARDGRPLRRLEVAIAASKRFLARVCPHVRRQHRLRLGPVVALAARVRPHHIVSFHTRWSLRTDGEWRGWSEDGCVLGSREARCNRINLKFLKLEGRRRPRSKHGLLQCRRDDRRHQCHPR